MSDTPTPPGNSLHDLWGYIRDKFPPARAAVAVGTFLLPLLATFNVWIADNAPWVDQYVNADERKGIFIATVGAGVFLIYKWMNGRAGWEQAQVAATGRLVEAGKLPVSVLSTDKNGNVEVPTEAPVPMDDDMILSMPSDIDETDSDPGDAPEREDRVEYDGPEPVRPDPGVKGGD